MKPGGNEAYFLIIIISALYEESLRTNEKNLKLQYEQPKSIRGA